MSLVPVQEVIYLSPKERLPQSLLELEGIRWRWMENLEILKSYIKSQFLKIGSDPIWIMVVVESLNSSLAQFYLNWTTGEKRLRVIFLSEVENLTISSMFGKQSRVSFFTEKSADSIRDLVWSSQKAKVQKNLPEQKGEELREFDRLKLNKMVIVKKNWLDEAQSNTGVHFVCDAEFKDFSANGAKIEMAKGNLSLADTIVLIFQDKNGDWHSMESEVRWLSTNQFDQQVVGVQFIKVSA